MPISLFPQLLFISLLSTIISITSFTHAHSQCLDDQKALLLEFKNELIFNSSFSRKLVHWNQTYDCCSWDGVECDGVGHVISLQLDSEAISSGIENSSLFSLGYLEKLNLAFNYFYDIQIPRGIHNLTYLTHLNLSNAGVGGEVPVELSLLKRLVSLDISSRNRANPPLKLESPNLKKLLQNLTKLRELYLDNVDISAQGSEWCRIISSSVPDLRILSLRGCDVSGPLDPSLLKVHALSVLQLDGNNLSTVVPDFFANFSSLTSLSLSECSLQGSFPRMIFQVPTLQNLDLSYNGLLSGTMPHFPQSRSFRSIVLRYTNFAGSLPHSISNLSMLSNMDLSHCKFSGPIPSTLTNLTKLTYVDLSYNFFIGSLSSMHFEGLSQLVYLDLGYNSLSGSISQSLFGLSSLRILFLNNNQFNGTFQLEKIQRLRNLTMLNLSDNNLSVDASKNFSSFSTFPRLYQLGLASCNLLNFPDLRNQSNLSYLDLSKNRIRGEIPSWIWEIGNGTLLQLNLSSNLLVDLQKPYKIPNSLEVLDLNSNQLQGEFPLPVPPNIGRLTSYLSFFSLANNSLSGAIPTSLCSAVNLQVLDLSVNKLSGNIPPCLIEDIRTLLVFNVERNNISGNIPDKFSVNCGLKTLDLSDNNFGGYIPMSLANCISLEVMNVGNNNITDSFPCMLSSSLVVLVLRSNRFHGELRCHQSWPNLQIIDIASNNFSGNLHPISFSRLRGMIPDSDAQLRRNRSSFNLLHPTSHYYRNELTLTIKGLELKLVKIWADFILIDFSCNNFRGGIPDAIGDLSSVYLLNLSHNALTGTIPKSFGKLRQLGSLDLSVNQLTGMIPLELAGLTFLSVLNLSYNNLVGMIPKGPQFQTFSADFFEGNTGLCGFPLNISCSNTKRNDSSPPKPEKDGKTEIGWGYVSAALGYVVGLGSFLWVLFCCQSLRQNYFEKVNQVLEKIFDRPDRTRRRGRRVLRNQVRRQSC